MLFRFISIITILLLLSTYCSSQKENNIWYFGNKAGLDFNNSPPTVLTNSAMNVPDGSQCGSISDENGDILFYTNGYAVWNKNHQIMANGTGLNGDTNAPNSGLIIPKPGSPNQYYIFTQTTFGVNPMFNGNLYYSVVNMQLNSGLGGVVSKNTIISTNIDGAFAVARHANCGQFWLICRKADTNLLQSFLINSSGISNSPIISVTGTKSRRVTHPTLRVSPNNDLLAATVLTTNSRFLVDGVFEIYNFNNSTGVINHKITLDTIEGPYTMEFSPNQKLVYGTSGLRNDDEVLQWDISLSSDSAMIKSKVILDSAYFRAGPHDLQLAPDGKIYLISGSPPYPSYYIGTIAFPNRKDTLCNYNRLDINLSRMSGVSFPRMLAPDVNGIALTDSCEGDTASFELLNPGMFISNAWNFGDSASGTNNYSSLTSPKHKFPGPGYYSIRLIGLDACFQFDTILDTIYIEPLPSYNLGYDTSICNGDTIILDASFAQSTYIWQDSTIDSVFYAFMDTSHWVEVTNGCGSVMDTILIDYRNFDDTDLGNDTSVCPGDSLLLDATTPFASFYKWQDNSSDSTLLVTMQGTYSVEVGNGCDTLQDSVDVFYINPPAINLGNDTSRCFPDSITLDGKLPGVNYLWYNGDTNQTITTSDTGILWVETSNFRCSARDSIYISIYDSLFVLLGEDTVLCKGQTLLLDATQSVSHLVNYLWQDSSSAPMFSVSNTGLYSVTVSDYCMAVSDTIDILFLDVPIVNLGVDTIICFGEDLVLNAGSDGTSYLWYDNTIDSINTVYDLGKYWVRVENKCGITSDTIVVSIRHAPNVFLGDDTTLCIDKTMTLDAYADDADYLWQDGATGRYYLVSKEGEYWVTVTNKCNVDNDSILAFYIEKPFIDLGNDTTICLDQRLILDVRSEKASYKWNDGSKDSIRLIRENGEYLVDVVNICGADQDEITVKVQDCSCRLYIPNSFTPNADGINDVFQIESKCNIVDFNIMVLNRWGEIIFESDNIDFQWDGFFRSKEIPMENYVYSIHLTYRNGQSIDERDIAGRVLLLR